MYYRNWELACIPARVAKKSKVLTTVLSPHTAIQQALTSACWDSGRHSERKPQQTRAQRRLQWPPPNCMCFQSTSVESFNVSVYNTYNPVLNVMGFTGLLGDGEETLKSYKMLHHNVSAVYVTLLNLKMVKVVNSMLRGFFLTTI